MLQKHPASFRRSERSALRPAAAAAGLSRRQREVLALLAEGVQARAIAVRLGLSEATVRNHIRLILRKLGCHSQLEAVAVAYRLGLVDPARSVEPQP
jgi:DNA-binding NarL/FixJ family response regulator